MKKLLFLVLIAIAFCTVIEEKQPEEDIVLQEIDWAGLWDKVKKFTEAAKKWLQEKGLWDPLITLLKTVGREAAMKWCTQKIPDFVCSSIIDFILGLLN